MNKADNKPPQHISPDDSTLGNRVEKKNTVIEIIP